jgi:hypothetical protein
VVLAQATRQTAVQAVRNAARTRPGVLTINTRWYTLERRLTHAWQSTIRATSSTLSEEAGDKKGDERKAFMSECLKVGAPAAPMTQQGKMKADKKF